MKELPDKISLFNVQRPKLLQESGGISNAQYFNQIVKMGEKVQRKNNLNPVPKTESAKKILANQADVESSQEEVAVENRKFTGKGFYLGTISPYPRPNNFLHNRRTGSGTTNFEG